MLTSPLTTSRTVKTGLVIAALLALTDAAGVFGGNGSEPMAIVVTDAILGLLTLAGVALAWQRRVSGYVIVIVTRALSALSAVPAFGAGVPAGVKVEVAVVIAVTLAIIAVLSRPLRTTARATA